MSGAPGSGREPPFRGFPAGARATPVPTLFFSRVLPMLTDPAALAVTTYVFYALQRKRGVPRWVSLRELAGETPLMTLLTGLDAGPRANQHRTSGTGPPHPSPKGTPAAKGGEATEEHHGTEAVHALRRGVDAAVELGVLLALPVRGDGPDDVLLFLNTPSDRRGMELARTGRGVARGAPPGGAIEARAPAPSVYGLYEENIGTLTPLVAEELEEAERLYPAAWIEAAMRRAVEANARSWRYVRRILERWAVEGPDDEKAGRLPASDADRRYLGGKYGRIIRSRIERA